MTQIQHTPDFIIAGKAFAYRDYNEQIAEAFGYDWESLERNRDKSMSDKQHHGLRDLRDRKVMLHGTLGIGLLLLNLLLQWSYPHDGQIPLTIRVIFVGSTVVMLTNAVIAWRRYTPELDYDLMTRAIAIPRINLSDKGRYTITFGEPTWTLTYNQYKIANTLLRTPDVPAGQYFVAYYTPRTKHLLSIEPITLVSDFSTKEEDDSEFKVTDVSIWAQMYSDWKAWWTAFWHSTNYHK